MKLLTAKEVKQFQGDKNIEKQKVIAEYNKNLKEFHNLKAKYETEKKILQENHQLFGQKLQKERDILVSEVAELQKLRKEALEPIIEERKELEDKIIELEAISEVINNVKRENNVQIQEIKTEKAILQKVKINADEKIRISEELSKEISQRLLDLEKKENNLILKKAEFDKNLLERNNVLEKKEKALAGQSEALQVLMKEYTARINKLEDREKHIYSQQESLKLAKLELDKKYANSLSN